MSTLQPVDIVMLALENPSRQMNIAFVEIIRVPAKLKKNYVAKVLSAYRSSEVAEPFNQRLKWHNGIPSLEEVEPDTKYHVRHIAIPAPGDMEKLYDVISFLNAPMLDRTRPLWECYIIEGLAEDRIAIYHKIHHALLDGVGTADLFEKSLSTTARARSITPMWAPFEDASAEKRPKKKAEKMDRALLKKLVSMVGELPHGLSNMSSEVASLTGMGRGKKKRAAQLPLGANTTLFNNLPTSSERRYANCQIPLDTAKAISRQTGSTINEVMMTIIDHGLQQYLRQQDAATSEPLVALMPISVKSDEDPSSGNQLAVELVKLGQPDARIHERLSQVSKSSAQAKSRSHDMMPAVRLVYSIAVMGSGILPELSDRMKSLPSSNLIISNVVGPQKKFYLAGAPVESMQALPILPPGHGLNVTFASLNDCIELAVGAAPEAVDDPTCLTQLFLDGLAELQSSGQSK